MDEYIQEILSIREKLCELNQPGIDLFTVTQEGFDEIMSTPPSSQNVPIDYIEQKILGIEVRIVNGLEAENMNTYCIICWQGNSKDQLNRNFVKAVLLKD